MNSAERAERIGDWLERQAIQTILPSPETMMTYRWFTELDEIANDFTESLAAQSEDPDKTRQMFERRFDGYSYQWTWTDTVTVEGQPVRTEVHLHFGPDRLLRGTEARIFGDTQTAILNPETKKGGFGTGGPELMGLGARLDVPSQKRTEILSRIRAYLPQAWDKGHQKALELPALERSFKNS